VKYSSQVTKDGSKNKTVGQFEVIGKAWDEQLGGSTFDLKITELLADRFNELWEKKKSKDTSVVKDVRLHARPITRLRNEAGKIREVLSANAEIPFKADQLHADVDISTKVTRTEFETISADLYDRLLVPINNALLMANISANEINAVELLGGGVRMPKVCSIYVDYIV
jgi:hypoxia up-regulated 1